MIHDLMPQGKGVVSLAYVVLCQMQGGSHSETLFTDIQEGDGGNRRIKVPDSLECAGSDICLGALSP